MVTEEMQNNFRKKDCVRKWKKVRETCLIHYKSERSAESPGQGGWHCLGGTVLCRGRCPVGEYAVGLRGTRTETGEIGRTSGCLGRRPRVIPCVKDYTSRTVVTQGKGKFAGLRGVSGTSFPLLAVETSHKMLWRGMVNRHSLTFRDLHPTRNKNWHDLTSSTWVADEQTVLSWQDTSSNGLEDELVNEPKTEFTRLKQNMCLLHAEVRFSKLNIVFEFHLMFDNDWFRALRDHSLLWQMSRFGS